MCEFDVLFYLFSCSKWPTKRNALHTTTRRRPIFINSPSGTRSAWVFKTSSQSRGCWHTRTGRVASQRSKIKLTIVVSDQRDREQDASRTARRSMRSGYGRCWDWKHRSRETRWWYAAGDFKPWIHVELSFITCVDLIVYSYSTIALRRSSKYICVMRVRSIRTCRARFSIFIYLQKKLGLFKNKQIGSHQSSPVMSSLNILYAVNLNSSTYYEILWDSRFAI